MNNLLTAGGQVTVSEPMSSSTGDILLTLFPDGNLVLQRPRLGTVLWQTNTAGPPGTLAIMQADGNFVLYDPGGTALWATGTWNNPGAWIILQDDGRLVVYSASGKPLWASSLPNILVAGQQLNPGDAIYSSAGRIALELQPDGNLVLNRVDTGIRLWQSNTAGQPGTHAIMQQDGNFVLYDSAGTALWFTGTSNNPGAWITPQDDGNLMVYAGNGTPLWGSNTKQTWPPMAAIENVSLVMGESNSPLYLIVGDTKFLIDEQEFNTLGLDLTKVRTVVDGLLDNFKTQVLHAPPETKASDVWFDCTDSYNLLWGTMKGNCKPSAAIVRKDVIVAGWFWNDVPPIAQLPVYPRVNYTLPGKELGGVEDIHYSIFLDADFARRMYGPDGLSTAMSTAIWPGNPLPGNPPGPVPFPFATDPPRTPGGNPVVTFNSWILPMNEYDVHGELNCWHVNDAQFKMESENWRGRGPAPAGWIREDWSKYPWVGQIADTDTWFPFDPLNPEGLGEAISQGDYVLMIGTIWQENNHAPGRSGWSNPPTVGQDGDTEMHPPDWVVRVRPPNANARITRWRNITDPDTVTGPPVTLHQTISPDFVAARSLQVRCVEQLIDPRFTKPLTIADMAVQVATDHVDVHVVLQPHGGEGARFKGAVLVGWSEIDALDEVWVDDKVPVGAWATGDDDDWYWEADNVFSGSVAHRSTLRAGVHQHYFTGAADPMVADAGDVLFAAIFLDPNNPPDEVMLQWHTSDWLSRAYWGANLIDWGTDGTSQRRYMGPLPPSGEWVRLSVRAQEVGIDATTPIDGMAFTLSGGRATWDYAGVNKSEVLTGWSGWTSLAPGVPFDGEPVVASNADGRLQVFARGTDSALWTMTQAAPGSSVWSAWTPLAPGVPFDGEPAVGINADGGGLLVFARGTDSALWAISQAAPGGIYWSAWTPLAPGSAITSDPVVGVNADGRLEVFARGTDSALWTMTQTAFPGGLYWPTAWTPLAPGSAITSDPVVGVNADGRLEVFARGTDDALWHIWQTAPDGGWSGWASLGGRLTSDPAAARDVAAVARNADGRLEVFTRGTDNALWHRWQTTPGGNWSGWARLAAGVPFKGEPVVGRNADGRLQVFVQGTDFALWTMTQAAPGSSTWSAWTSLAPGVPFVGEPVVASNADGRLQVFARGTDSALWTITQIAPNN